MTNENTLRVALCMVRAITYAFEHGYTCQCTTKTHDLPDDARNDRAGVCDDWANRHPRYDTADCDRAADDQTDNTAADRNPETPDACTVNAAGGNAGVASGCASVFGANRIGTMRKPDRQRRDVCVRAFFVGDNLLPQSSHARCGRPNGVFKFRIDVPMDVYLS